jgi:hypothetical protein
MSTCVEVIIDFSGNDWHTQRVGGLWHRSHVSLATLERSSSLRSVFATLDAILVFMLGSYEKDAAYMMHALKISTYCIRCNRLFIVLSGQLGKNK